VACVIIWLLSNFNWRLEMVAADRSMLAAIGNMLAPLFAPLGWGDWKAAVASLTGMFAKENVVGTLGVLYGFEGAAASTSWAALQAAYSGLAGYSFLLFNLLCAPCFATIGAINSEMGSAKWTWAAIGYQTVLAYTMALIVYQLGMFFTGHGFGVGTGVAVLAILLLLHLLLRRGAHDTDVVGDKRHGHSRRAM
ncbi:MAG: nucleoside recognition domain-containing protein, partial [Syntrophomonadaceae bacterium]|nr:nucleoside recognition domain-containing protein [Syntrophomonadaceae bacterium]